MVAGNEQGKILFDSLLQPHETFQEHLKTGKPFHLILDNGMLLKGSPLEGGTEFLIEWHELSETETRLALLQAVSKSVNSSLILEEIFDSLGEVLRTFIPFDAGTIVILDESQNSTRVVVSLDARGQAEIKGDSNIFAGYDLLIDTLLHRPHSTILTAPFPKSVLVHAESRQAILVPLVSKGLVIGTIGLSGESYTQAHLNLLEEISEQLAVAVENARLYWQTQRQAGREFLINQLTKAIRQSLNIQQILETTVQEVGKVMGLSRCRIHYWAELQEDMTCFEYVLPGIEPIENTSEHTAFERELFLKRSDAQQRFNPFILNDCRGFTTGQPLLQAGDIKSLAVFPILIQEKTFVGTISLHQCDTFRAWVAEDIELLKAIAEHVAVALHQANLFQEKENQRQQLEDTLNELQQAQIQLVQSEKMAVLGQFVAGIAHEINTPLGTLIANDDTARRCLEQIDVTDESEKYRASALDLLKINHMAADRIQEIVRNLRNFARLDESDLKLADIHEGLDSTLLLIHHSIKNKITVIKQYTELPKVECFPGLLNQVFMNILVNAVHSIEAHGTITVATRYNEVTHEIEVAIGDTGKGILPEHLNRIFDPGFTTKGVGVGTGLGLALCYKIMEKHHGRILVESTVGQGTTMTVVLPAQQPHSHKEA